MSREEAEACAVRVVAQLLPIQPTVHTKLNVNVKGGYLVEVYLRNSRGGEHIIGCVQEDGSWYDMQKD